MTFAIDYIHAQPAPDSAGDVLGINVAVDDLLKALFRYGKQDKFICRPANMPSYDHFRRLAQGMGVDADTRCIGLDPRTPQHNLTSINCLFRPDPALAELASLRQQLPDSNYATCGLLHSLSGEQISRTVNALCHVPMGKGDALICPSIAIRDAVRTLWGHYAEDMNRLSGNNYHCKIQTPVIPLGIDTDKFSKRMTPDKRRSQREQLNITDDEVVILFVGRLSFATKAHPLPLLMAAEQAARHTKRKLRLIMYGYFKPQDIMEPRFRALAQNICKTINCDFITNSDPRFPEGLWACADIFTSLVDNIQESFGLTPIEAMACGLPVVATDWDGYRDGIRHGTDGFLIPTCMPPASAGDEIAKFYASENNYGTYLCATAQSTAIDITAAATAFVTLAEDDDMRRSMGESGKSRAQNTYDWKAIIPAYETLWLELGASYPAHKGTLQSIHAPISDNAAYPNPLAIFAGFASTTLFPSDKITVTMSDKETAAILGHDMNIFIPELLMPPNLIREFVTVIRKAGKTAIKDMLALFPPPEQPRLWRCIGWMLKHGVAIRETS